MNKLAEQNLEQQQWPLWYRAWKTYAGNNFIAYELTPETEDPAEVCIRFGDRVAALIISSCDESCIDDNLSSIIHDLESVRGALE